MLWQVNTEFHFENLQGEGLYLIRFEGIFIMLSRIAVILLSCARQRASLNNFNFIG